MAPHRENNPSPQMPYDSRHLHHGHQEEDDDNGTSSSGGGENRSLSLQGQPGSIPYPLNHGHNGIWSYPNWLPESSSSPRMRESFQYQETQPPSPLAQFHPSSAIPLYTDFTRTRIIDNDTPPSPLPSAHISEINSACPTPDFAVTQTQRTSIRAFEDDEGMSPPETPRPRANELGYGITGESRMGGSIASLAAKARNGSMEPEDFETYLQRLKHAHMRRHPSIGLRQEALRQHARKVTMTTEIDDDDDDDDDGESTSQLPQQLPSPPPQSPPQVQPWTPQPTPQPTPHGSVPSPLVMDVIGMQQQLQSPRPQYANNFSRTALQHGNRLLHEPPSGLGLIDAHHGLETDQSETFVDGSPWLDANVTLLNQDDSDHRPSSLREDKKPPAPAHQKQHEAYLGPETVHEKIRSAELSFVRDIEQVIERCLGETGKILERLDVLDGLSNDTFEHFIKIGPQLVVILKNIQSRLQVHTEDLGRVVWYDDVWVEERKDILDSLCRNLAKYEIIMGNLPNHRVKDIPILLRKLNQYDAKFSNVKKKLVISDDRLEWRQITAQMAEERLAAHNLRAAELARREAFDEQWKIDKLKRQKKAEEYRRRHRRERRASLGQ